MPTDKPSAMLLTGCASGIGRHLADVLIERGFRIMATDANIEALRAHATRSGWPVVASGTDARVLLRELDVRSAADWDAAVTEVVETFGSLDVLFNIAGVVEPAYIHEADPGLIDRHLDINAKGTMLGTRAAVRQMIEQGSGHIVNFASLAGLAPVPGIALYSASKFAVRGFSLAVAAELKPLGVAVTCVCPDAVRTAMVDYQQAFEQAALTFSGNRMLTVEDIERAILSKVLPRRPVELTLPWSRGLVARLTGFLPSLMVPLVPLLRRRGLARQRAYVPTQSS